MPADDIITKQMPAIPVVAIGAPAAGFGPGNLREVIHRIEEQFNELDIRKIVGATGPYITFYEEDPDDGTLVANVGVTVDDQRSHVPPPARYLVLPPIQAAVAVRRGAGVFPYVYQDLGRWADDHDHRLAGHGREVWLRTAVEAGGIEGQVIEVQLPFATTR